MPRLHIIHHINRMSKTSFNMLSLGLLVFSSSLCALAVNLCNDYRGVASDLIYRYPPLLEEITVPFIFLVGASLILDINEKRRQKNL